MTRGHLSDRFKVTLIHGYRAVVLRVKRKLEVKFRVRIIRVNRDQLERVLVNEYLVLDSRDGLGWFQLLSRLPLKPLLIVPHIPTIPTIPIMMTTQRYLLISVVPGDVLLAPPCALEFLKLRKGLLILTLFISHSLSRSSSSVIKYYKSYIILPNLDT